MTCDRHKLQDKFSVKCFFCLLPIFSNEDLKKFTIFDIGMKTNTEEDAFEFAKELGLIRILDFCNNCKLMGKKVSKSDRYSVRCPRCLKKWSLLKNTIFYNSKTTIKSIIRLIYFFTMKISNKKAISQTGLTSKTVIK